MKETFSTIWQALSSIAGAIVLVVLVGWLARMHSRMWRLASARYAGPAPSARIATRTMDTIVVTGRRSTGPLYTGNIAYRAYPVKISVHEDNLALSATPPFNLMCPKIHLPFDEMALEQTHWALWPEPFAIRMQRLPDIDIVLGRDTVHWVRNATDRSPFGPEA